MNKIITTKLNYICEKIGQIEKHLEKINDKIIENISEIAILKERTKDLNTVKLISGIISGLIAFIISLIISIIGISKK
jgi:hypothetical protein